jgi:glycosyltransferase involved in cell wall biosynthesis
MTGNMLQKYPLVSVIVPAYNRAELMIDTLESIWQQTYRPIELIVVDDGSTDDTRDRVIEWAGKHDSLQDFDVRYLQQQNKGANSARNLGIQNSQGELVAFIDSDDRWLSDKLEKQVPLFGDDPDIGGVYCGLGWVDLASGIKLPDERRSYPKGWLLPKLLVYDVTAGTPCYVIKRECFDKVGFFDVSLPARQDWDMWIRLSTEYKIACVREVLVYAGKHAGARLSLNAEGSIAAHWLIFNKYAPLRKRFPLSIRQSAKGALFRRLGRIYFHYGLSKRKALAMYLKAIFAWPFCFDSYAALAGIFMPANLRQKINIQWNKIFGKTPLAIRSF